MWSVFARDVIQNLVSVMGIIDMAKLPTMDEFAKDCAMRAMDDIQVNGKSLREWAQDIIEGEYVPVIHARWEGTEYDGYAEGYPAYDKWQCSNCGAEFCCEDMDFDYCPRCGAKMDLEEPNETGD